jgi:hypothetical protein
MAKELNLLPNPDNVPGAVSTGYQRQNTNMFAIQTGLNTLRPIDNVSTVTIETGGLIEVNGSIFKMITPLTLTKPSYVFYIAISDNGDGTASLSISSTQGTWSQAKQGYYLSNGSRTINNYLYNTNSGTGTIVYSKTTKGSSIISIAEGKYRGVLVSGKGGNNVSTRIANVSDTVECIFYHDGKRQLQIIVGGDGYDGGNGAGGCGAGGCGAGEASEIVGIAKTKQITAGKSGSGQSGGFAGRGGQNPGFYKGYSYDGNGGDSGFGGGSNGEDGTIIDENEFPGGGGGGSGGLGGRTSFSTFEFSPGGDSAYGSNGGNGVKVNRSGASGAAGGAPGWQRPDEDSNCGSVKIYRL